MNKYELPFSEFKILGQDETEELLRNEPNKWNVVSISIPDGCVPLWAYAQPNMKYTKSFVSVKFHDQNIPAEGVVLCEQADIQKVLNYTAGINNEPLLVHCAAGVSRSAAMAILILLERIKDLSDTAAEEVAAIVKHYRPICMPNRHILGIGIPMVARDESEAIKFFRQIWNSSLWK